MICLLCSVWDLVCVWFEVCLEMVLFGYSVIELVIVDVLVWVIDVFVDCFDGWVSVGV